MFESGVGPTQSAVGAALKSAGTYNIDYRPGAPAGRRAPRRGGGGGGAEIRSISPSFEEALLLATAIFGLMADHKM